MTGVSKFGLWGLVHFLVSRYLPIDSEIRDQQEIRLRTIRSPLNFTHPVWQQSSNQVKDLIWNFMQKNPRHRLTIDQILEHVLIL
jgi:hypothetical protein